MSDTEGANIVATFQEMLGLLELQNQRLQEAGDELLRYGNAKGPTCKMDARSGEGFRKKWLLELADADPAEHGAHAASLEWMDRAVAVALARLDRLGHPRAVGCDLAGAWGMLKGILQQREQTRPALTESQREALLIVAEVTGDLIIHAEAVESGARSRPDATELLAWAEELQRPARLLETLFDLAPKESTPEPDPPIEQFEPMLEDWTPDPQEGGTQP